MHLQTEYLTIPDLALEAGVTRMAVQKRIWDGKLPAYRAGKKCWLIARHDAEAYEARHAKRREKKQ
jgi:hypothetical protein